MQMKTKLHNIITTNKTNFYNIIKRDFPQQFVDIMQIDGKNFSEKCYVYLFGRTNNCSVCNNPTKFENFFYGYKKTCCRKCASIVGLNSIKQKFKVDNVSSLPHIKQKKKATCLQRYNVENPFQLETVKRKSRKTMLQRFGVEFPSQAADVQQKIQASFRRSFYQNLISNHNLNQKVQPLFSEQEYITTDRYNQYKFRCLKCDNTFHDHIDGGHLPRCQLCYPVNKGSIAKQEIYDYVVSIIDPSLVQRNVRHVIKGELDIYIPSLNIAIEYDSFYYHRYPLVDKNYHLTKTEQCETLGIHLLHIFEDEWMSKQLIVQRKLQSILVKLPSTVYARKCIVRSIDAKTASTFLTEHHIQGAGNGSIRVGAFHENILVAVMTFGKNRISLGQKSTPFIFELSRFAGNQRIVGIFNKMLQYFIKNHGPKKIISYADRRFSFSNSTIYSKSNFMLVSKTVPNYWYFKCGYSTKYHRFTFRKDVLKAKLPIFDPTLSGYANMQINGYDKIFDCGSLKYELSL